MRAEIVRELKLKYPDYVEKLVGKRLEQRTFERKLKQMERWYRLATKIGLIAVVLSNWIQQYLITNALDDEFEEFLDNFTLNIGWIHDQVRELWADAPSWLRVVGCMRSYHITDC